RVFRGVCPAAAIGQESAVPARSKMNFLRLTRRPQTHGLHQSNRFSASSGISRHWSTVHGTRRAEAANWASSRAEPAPGRGLVDYVAPDLTAPKPLVLAWASPSKELPPTEQAS